jgi:hypothetical protein
MIFGEFFDAVPHLFSGFVGEGDSEDFIRGDANAHQMRDPECYNACLSRASSCNDESWPFQMMDGSELSWI